MRVADFGVARALAEAAWTEPAGAMVGTARYISPEAAEGKPVDGRADVYSLALVLYEAVTGTVPFVTDTTMGTLAARIGQPLPHDDALGPLGRRAGPGGRARRGGPARRGRAGRPVGRAGRRVADAGPLAARHPAPRGLDVDHPRVPGPGRVGADGLGRARRRVPRRARPRPRSHRAWRRLRRRPRRRSGPRPGRGRSSTPSPTAARSRTGGRRRRAAGAPLGCGRRRWWIVAAIAAGGDRGRRAGGRVRDRRCSRPRTRRRRWSTCRWPRPGRTLAKVHMILKVGRAGEVDHGGRRRRRVPEPEARRVAEGGLDGHGRASPTGKPDVTVPSLAGMTCAQADGGAAVDALPVGVRAGRLQRQRPGRRARPVVHRLDPEPDQGALRGHDHARPLAGPFAGDRAQHPDQLHLRSRPRPRSRRSG